MRIVLSTYRFFEDFPKRSANINYNGWWCTLKLATENHSKIGGFKICWFQNFRRNMNVNRLLFADRSVSKSLRALKFKTEIPLKMLVGLKKVLVGFKYLGEIRG